jgi:hypothetical protein
MLVRALIVLLLVLNVGVAAWWIARPAPPPPAEEKLPMGVARLQIVGEDRLIQRSATAATADPAAPATQTAAAPPVANAAAHSAPAPSAATAPAPGAAKPTTPATPPAAAIAATTPPASPLPAPEPAAKAQCFSVGPFADAAAADAARAKLQPLAQKMASRSEGASSKSSRGWRVYLPTANAEAAQATAQRIRAAGFNDLFVMSGADANAIALGRFRSEESARKRGNELSAAGFAARVEALGESASGATWIDVATTTANGDTLRRAAGASRWRGRSCAGLG